LTVLVHFLFFFFNDTATTEIYTLSLHDALPISNRYRSRWADRLGEDGNDWRSEEHMSELQSPCNLVCRLLLEKKKKHKSNRSPTKDPHCAVTPPTARGLA